MSETRVSRNKRYRSIFPEKTLLRNARYRARQQGVECALEVEDIVIPEVCPVLGIVMAVTPGMRSDSSPSLDRILPGRGYTKDNIIVCSWKANRVKSNCTIDELVMIAEYWKKTKEDE